MATSSICMKQRRLPCGHAHGNPHRTARIRSHACERNNRSAASRSAEAAAVRRFNLSPQQRSRLVVQERAKYSLGRMLFVTHEPRYGRGLVVAMCLNWRVPHSGMKLCARDRQHVTKRKGTCHCSGLGRAEPGSARQREAGHRNGYSALLLPIEVPRRLGTQWFRK